MSVHLVAAAAAIAALGSAPLLAQPAAKTSQAPQSVRTLLDCRTIQPAELRLACFDRAAASLAAATSAGDVVIVDRQQVRAARRSLFGFSLPSLGLFGGRNDGDPADEVKEIKSQVKRAYSLGYGKYRVVIAAEDAIWETTDTSVSLRQPRPGDEVHVKKGSFGSYFIKLGSQPWVKGRRTQ